MDADRMLPRESTMDALHISTCLDDSYRATCTRLNVDEPWFGAFVLNREGKHSEYRVGTRRHPDERIVDWRHPLARAYYDHRPGDAFKLRTPGYVHFTGILEYCAAVEARSRTLVRVEIAEPTGQHVVVATPHGFAFEEPQPHLPTSEHGLPDVLALITPEQYRLITASRSQPLIVQGRAGSGKTTVALYRVAWLTYAPDEDATVVPVDPSKVLIVMFKTQN